MNGRLQRWLAPPVFPADETKTRRAGLLNTILWVSITAALCLFIGNLVGGRTPPVVTWANILIVLVCLGLRYWMQKGRVQLASSVLVAFGLTLATWSIAQLGTIRTPSTALYLLAIAVAGLLFDLTGLLLVTGFSSLAVAGLILAENAGALPSPDYFVTITQWVSYTVIFSATGGLMFYYIRTMRQALEQANREIAERKQAEGILRESKERFSSVFHATPTRIALTRFSDGVFLDANESFLDSIGFSRAEVIGYTSADLDNWVDPAERAHLRSLLDTQGMVRNFEARLRRKSGENMDVLISADIIKISGKPCILSTSLDITERKQMEEELRRATLYMRSLIEASLDPLVTISSEGKITDVNQATELVTGVARDVLIGSDFSDYFTEPEKARKGYLQVFSQGFVRDYSLAIRHISGKATDVLYNATVYRSATGKVQGVFAAARDITERKRAEEALRESETRLRAIYEGTDIGLAFGDLSGRFVEINPALQRILGYSLEELQGLSITDITHPNDLALDEKQFREMLAGMRDSYQIEKRYLHKYGHIVHALVSIALVRGVENKPLYTFSVIEDITDRKRAEEMRQQAAIEERQRLARELHDTVSQTIYSASLIAETLPRVQARKPELLHNGLRDLQRLTRGALAEMRSLLFELRPSSIEQVRLNDLLQQLANSVMGRTRLEVRVEADRDSNLPVEVRLAFFRTAQEALNNIVKHAEARHVTLSHRDLPPLSVIIDSPPLPGVELSIRDDGRGFDPQHIQPGHHGLGILRERAAAIGAQLSIASQPGQGAEITITWRGNFNEEQQP